MRVRLRLAPLTSARGSASWSNSALRGERGDLGAELSRVCQGGIERAVVDLHAQALARGQRLVDVAPVVVAHADHLTAVVDRPTTARRPAAVGQVVALFDDVRVPCPVGRGDEAGQVTVDLAGADPRE